MSQESNQLTQSLTGYCREHVLREKWLLCRSKRIANEWLESVVRSGQPIINVRIMTLQNLALELASSEMEKTGSAFLRGLQIEILINRVFEKYSKGNHGYFSGLTLSHGLSQAVGRSIRELRLAGIISKDLRVNDFEVQAKGREIKALLENYEEELQLRNYVDYSDVLRMAIKQIEQNYIHLSKELAVLLPDDMETDFRGLERMFWEAIPLANQKILKTDYPAEKPLGTLSDAVLLQWISEPSEAPEPASDNTAQIFRAVGSVNEVREVFRRCLERNISFDDVEIICTDSATYVPLIYELASRPEYKDQETLPVTFSNGIPTYYSRPAKALKGWLFWMREDYPQSTLVRMLQDGLLQLYYRKAEKFSFTGIGAIFQSVPIGNGKDRYLQMIDKEIAALKVRVDKIRSTEPDEVHTNDKRSDAYEKVEVLKSIRPLVETLISLSREPDQNQKLFLTGAAEFLQNNTRCISRFDEYSRIRLLDEIEDLNSCLNEGDRVEGDLLDWLSNLTQELTVEGRGPRPGCLYVTNIDGGAHSGRKHTFVIGLDDSRFPGTGLQDPLLLDKERNKISRELSTGGMRLAKNIESFERLLTRMRGNVTLSYSCRNLIEDREIFPSPVLYSAYRILSGNHTGDHNDFLRWLPPPASFAPTLPGRCIDSTEWWLWRLCGDEEIENVETTVSQLFPPVRRGYQALRARASDEFTEYDGYVPEAGDDLDPTKSTGCVLSASRLEKLGTCPLEYFFQYVLEIKPPEEYRIEPGVWLDHLQKGTLLHTVFRKYMNLLTRKEQRPDFKRDEQLMHDLLSAEVEILKSENPPPNEDVFNRDVRELQNAVRIFLLEEQTYCWHSMPVFFEASIGVPPEGRGTLLDTRQPVTLYLPKGSHIRAQGRIDRVDKMSEGERQCFVLWDYKTGRSYGYDQNDPFRNGRRVQNILYYLIAESRLKEIYPGSEVSSFGYFFPGTREHGRRISWTSEELKNGDIVLEQLCRMLATGCFPFTNDLKNDVIFSDYMTAFGDKRAAAAAIQRKLENTDNEVLEPFRTLRGVEQSSDNE